MLPRLQSFAEVATNLPRWPHFAETAQVLPKLQRFAEMATVLPRCQEFCRDARGFAEIVKHIRRITTCFTEVVKFCRGGNSFAEMATVSPRQQQSCRDCQALPRWQQFRREAIFFAETPISFAEIQSFAEMAELLPRWQKCCRGGNRFAEVTKLGRMATALLRVFFCFCRDGNRFADIANTLPTRQQSCRDGNVLPRWKNLCRDAKRFDETPQVLPRLHTHIVKHLTNVRRLHSVAEMAKNVEMATILLRRQKCCRGGKVLPGWPKFYRDGSSCA
jgi:hypothetical protein